MVSLVAFVALAQSQTSLYRQLFPNPTGLNGYEEYVLAAQSLQDGVAAQLLQGPIREGEQPTDSVRAGLVGKTPLQIERIVWARYGSAIELVAKGNGKAVANPRSSIGPNTLFREFYGFKLLSRVGTAGAHVLYADGSPRAATRVLTTLFAMAEKIKAHSLVSHLVGVAIEAQVTASIDENLDRLCEADWRAIAPLATGYLASPPTLGPALASEVELAEASFDLLEPQPHSRPSDPGRPTAGNADDLSSLTRGYTDTQLHSLRDSVLAAVRLRHEGLVAMLRKPEREWGVVPITLGDPTVAKAVECVSPDYESVLAAETKLNTQVRLLLLHSKIQLFRWHTGRLPTRLTEIVDSVEDPASGQAFQYEPGPRGRYELYSVGSGSTGRVDLKYVRPPDDEGDRFP